MGTTEHAVVIAGGGPAGMMLAAELALANVDVAIVERRTEHVLPDARAGGPVTPRAIASSALRWPTPLRRLIQMGLPVSRF